MSGLVAAALAAFWVVFAAELGDKTQLFVLVLATRFPAFEVLIAITVTAAILQGVAVGVGAVLGASLPERAVSLAAGLLFVAFGLWGLRGAIGGTSQEHEAEEEAEERSRAATGSLIAACAAFALGELGDKTQIATVGLATRQSALGTWIGATLGLVAADALAIVVGRVLGARLPERAVRLGGAAVFVAFGVLLLVQTARVD
ncbi:MAG: TMEM165/GDT1 family protein [Acidimicrobiales bacterium]|nr:TMEM165/GDT1 family protein [Acidimicrobiales bacterium]